MSVDDDLDLLMGFEPKPSLYLEEIKRTDVELLKHMSVHYSQPKGFVGRNICYAVVFGERRFGSTVVGSAVQHLAKRDEFFQQMNINNICNNLFYHVEKIEGKYPCRNFTTKVITVWRQRVISDWLKSMVTLFLVLKHWLNCREQVNVTCVMDGKSLV